MPTLTQDDYRVHLRAKIASVPQGLRDGLIEYVVSRRPMGHFLTAVVSNNLSEACARADGENKYRLYDIVFFLYNYCPSGCWGSPEKVSAWLNAQEPPPIVLE